MIYHFRFVNVKFTLSFLREVVLIVRNAAGWLPVTDRVPGAFDQECEKQGTPVLHFFGFLFV